MAKGSNFAERPTGQEKRALEEREPRPGALAARDELNTLEKLSRVVWSVLSEFSKRRTFKGKISEVDLAINDVQQSRLKGYEELAHHCYGRTVTGSDTDDNDRAVGRFTYRITQANVGDASCGIVARNSPLASQLVTVQAGEVAEVDVPRGTRCLKVDEVRIFEGPSSLLAPSQPTNFRLMTLRRANLRTPITVSDLSGFIRAIEGPSSGVLGTGDTSVASAELPTSDRDFQRGLADRRIDTRDPTWLDDWSGIYLGASDVRSLGHQFFTRTTSDQERALNNPRGVTFVEGIAGAGKTSVALGRLKFFANFATGENREHYGLQTAAESDFSPAGMTGFVLNHSLKRYLHETAIELGLERLPIWDFPEFRSHLSNQFGLTQVFKRSKAAAPTVRTKLAWLRAIDAALANAAGVKLESLALKAPDIAQTVRDCILRLSKGLVGAKPYANDAAFHLAGLARRVAEEVMTVEFRAREAAIRERMKQEKFTLELERDLVRVQTEEERGLISPFVRTLLSLLAVQDLFVTAIEHQEFPEFVREAFERVDDAALVEGLDDAIENLRLSVLQQEEGGRRALTDGDLVVLISAAALIADGYENPDAQLRFFQLRRNTGAFIDEVQDFTEIEIFLMGMSVKREYSQITLSGDRCQRLQKDGSTNYQDLFPLVPKPQHNRSIFLDHNFRQRDQLAAVSRGFRAVLQADGRIDRSEDATYPAAVYSFSSREQMATLVVRRLQSVDPYATVAIVVPTEQEAKEWFDLVGEELASGHRPALLSRRDDLTRRVDIHVTAVAETKGLEFDVVVVPDLSSFALDNEIGRNEAYVAVSRAKFALLMGCNSSNSQRPELLTLATHRVIQSAGIPTH